MSKLGYEKMWNALKRAIEDERDYHHNSENESIESIHGEAKCKEFLKLMKEIEDEANIIKGEE